MRKWMILAAILLAAMGVAFVAGCQRSEPVANTETEAKIGTGKMAPDFTLKDLKGNTVRLSDHRGKIVFLNFWATWCPPCLAEMPAMERLAGAMNSKDFVILALNVENDDKGVREFLARSPYSFTVLLDSAAQAQELYKVYRFPETFLIDKEGKIIEHYIGGRDWSAVEFLKYVSTLAGE